MNFGNFIPFFDKLVVGNYAFGRKNEKNSSKFPRLKCTTFPSRGSPIRNKNSKYITKLTKGVKLVKKTKEYERAELDVLLFKIEDVITTSSTGGEQVGDEDSFGWA